MHKINRELLFLIMAIASTMLLLPFFIWAKLYALVALWIFALKAVIISLSENHGNNFWVIHLGTNFRIPSKYLLVGFFSFASLFLDKEINLMVEKLESNSLAKCAISKENKNILKVTSYGLAVVSLPAHIMSLSTSKVVAATWIFPEGGIAKEIAEDFIQEEKNKAISRMERSKRMSASELALDARRKKCEIRGVFDVYLGRVNFLGQLFEYAKKFWIFSLGTSFLAVALIALMARRSEQATKREAH